MALHPNFDTRDDCSKWVHRPGASRVQRMRLLPIVFPGKNRGMHPHRVQLLHAEVSVHPHRMQMHPALVHFGDYDDKSFLDFEYTHKAIVGFISTKWFCYESNSSKQR